MRWLRYSNPLTVEQAERAYVKGDVCVSCERPINLELPALRDDLTKNQVKNLGVRCADCLKTFCVPCSYRHFGTQPPHWHWLRAPNT